MDSEAFIKTRNVKKNKNIKNITLLEILAETNLKTPDKTAFTLYKERPCSFAELWKGINCLASYLIDNGLKSGEPVIILLENSKEFFYAFYGVMRAGGIAVPLFPGSGPDRIIRMADLCKTDKIIVSERYSQDKKNVLQKKTDNYCIRVIDVEIAINVEEKKIFPEICADDTAFIQFTSGSIGDPKGVMITHNNLITNIRQMILGMKITEDDVFVSWLPVYHDMGLILMTMVPLYLGLDLTLLPTGLNYLKTWIEVIEKKQASFTAAPDFAYRYCLIFIKDPAKHKISSLRVALNAAESVRSTTVAQFEKTFKLKNILLPAYGLAEATVGVCCSKPGKKIKVDKRGFVSVGRPFPDIEISIWDKDVQVKNFETGEIRIKSTANTIGYYKNAESTKLLFDKNKNIKTGDHGYLDENGNCYIIGREKNIIIHGGINISAREIEELTDQLSFVRRSAAIGIDNGKIAGEQVYIFLEIRLNKSQLKKKDIYEVLNQKTINSFYNSFGFRPGRVYFIKSGSIPMTYNGKIKYIQLKEQYNNGLLRNIKFILYPEY